MQEFQGLIDWCQGKSDHPHLRRVVGATFWENEDETGAVVALWQGYLDYSGPQGRGIEARFHGELPVVPGAGVHTAPLECAISVAAHRAWGALTGERIPTDLAEDAPIGVVDFDPVVEGSMPDHFWFSLSPAYNFAE